MSKPVEEFEISGLIDGELDATRAAEVRSAIERDPALYAQFASLVEANQAWAAAAESARFIPALAQYGSAPSPSRACVWIGLALVFMLAAGRCFLKFALVELATGMLIHALMLAAVIAVVMWISGHAAREENTSVSIAA